MYMKKMYLPTKEELKVLSLYKGSNIYKYILVKVVEKLITNHVLLSNMDESLKDIEELTSAICYIYPQKILHSKFASDDKRLCERIIYKNTDKSIYELDNLEYFSNDVQTDYKIVLSAIDKLYEKLPDSPEYRFSYHDNLTLDMIFLVDGRYFSKYSNLTVRKLFEIEPAYLLYLPNNTPVSDNTIATISIDNYANRYGIPYDVGKEFVGESILNSSSVKIKKLINYLYK